MFLLLVPGLEKFHDPLRKLAAHPADTIQHLGMLAPRFRGGTFTGQISVAQQGVQVAVAGAMKIGGGVSTLGFGQPVVPIHTVVRQHNPAVDRTNPYSLSLFFFGYLNIFLLRPGSIPDFPG